MASAQQVGRGRCPVCDSDRARFALSKKQLVCMTCDACNVQVFARSDRSDGLLRERIKERVQEPAQDAAPAAPAAAPAAPAPAPAAAGWAWGLMGGG